jgi:predicted amidohydrolase
LASNYIGEKYFGGAFIISEDGHVLSSLDLGKEAMLIGEV